jgi:hypothetical protein
VASVPVLVGGSCSQEVSHRKVTKRELRLPFFNWIKMKAFLFTLVVSILMLLAGCEAKTYESKGKFIVPDDLKDCKFYAMKPEGGNTVTVIRCPNSSTSAQYATGGKSSQNILSVTIDGVEYQEVKKEKQ